MIVYLASNLTFASFNFIVGGIVVTVLERFYVDGWSCSDCNLRMGILFIFGVFGLACPFLIGYMLEGGNLLFGLALMFTSVILPYGYWVNAIICHGRIRCFFYEFFCKERNRRKLENSIITKKVIEEVEDAEAGENGNENGGILTSNKKLPPKSDIVKRRKHKNLDDNTNSTKSTSTNASTNVKNKKARSESNGISAEISAEMSTEQTHDEESIFPITLPEENPNSNDEGDNESNDESIDGDIEDDDEESNGTDLGGTSNSVQLCNICLGEYEVGEEIAWSKNDECHHAFHKECLLEWLCRNDTCPICRNTY
jgi:hypothetical protein